MPVQNFDFAVQEERTFSDEEEEKLQGAFGISSKDLDLVLQTLEFILQQVPYVFEFTILLIFTSPPPLLH